jgi:hypothetical protein
MKGYLRQSTAVTVPVGPFVDDADGNAEETGLTVAQADVRLSKNGGANAQKNNASAATHDADGVYLCPLSTTDTNTLGVLTLWVHVAGALFVRHEYMVIPANIWDSWFSTDLQQVDVRELVGVTMISGAIPAVAAGANGGLPLGNGSGAVTLASATHTGAVIPTVTTLTNAPSDSSGVTTLLSRLPAGLFTGLSNFAHWLGALAGKQAANATAQTEIRASGAGSGTFDPTTDSLEAIRDAGASLDDIEERVQDVVEANHLDHLLAVTYDPASKPGASDALLNELVESDSGVARFTANSLEQAPTGAGGDGSAFTAIPWNAAWDAEVQSEVTDALNAYDPPTRTEATADKDEILAAAADIPTVAEFNARTLAAASYATAANQATMDGKLDTIDNLIDAEIQAIIDALALINADTDDIQSRLPAALVGGRMDSNASAINASTAAAVRLALSAGQIIPGTVDHSGTPATTTQLDADDITTAAADHYNGRVIIFTSGSLIGQATSISDYALVAGRGRFTVPALTAAPADNVTFIIV